MEGITILAEKQIEIFGFHSVAAWITVAICVAISVGLGIWLSIDNAYEWWQGVIMTVICAIIGLGFGFIIPVGYETVYEVTIDESVSMTEFLEQYEIIEQRGRIFTIREIAE